jgi:hypothetical protein
VRIIASFLGALLLALGGFGLAGCNDDNGKSITNSPGVNQKPVQPTTGTVGSEAPTPPVSTANTATGTTG